MRTSLCMVAFCLIGLFFCGTPVSAQKAKTTSTQQVRGWWNQGPKVDLPKSVDPKALPLISVRGNTFVSAAGDTILFRGVAVADPQKLLNDGHWNKELFTAVRQMGANIVRIPVHPIAWRELAPEKCLALLTQAVDWCTQLKMYVLIDWHSIGNLKTGLFQDPVYNTSLTETFEFWRAIAQHFSGNNTVAFYELFNEPTTYFNRLGRVSWDEWKKMNEDIIAVVRAYDKETIPLVAGLDWAYDLTPLRINPVEAEGIGYVTHPYPHKRTPPWFPKWEEDFGFAAGQFPVFATELGFSLGKEGAADNLEYGMAATLYLEGKGIGWIAWIFDPDWTPAMLQSWDGYTLTESGQFFKNALQRRPHPRR
jgi:endoglucanase